MLNRSKRWISLVLALVLCASSLIIPASADEAANLTGALPLGEVLPEELDPTPVEEIEPEVPMVNILPETDAAVGEEENTDIVESGTEDESSAGLQTGDGETPSEENGSVSEESASEESVAGEDAVLDGTVEYTVTYYSGTTVLATETVSEGATPVQVPAVDGGGTAIAGWLSDAGTFVTPATMTISGPTDLYAWYAPALETTAHNRYVNGVGDNMFAPYDTLTRAEAATILYNLLVSKDRGPYSASFGDVSSGHWYYEAVMTLASYKVLNGYGNGCFYPNDGITRAEFVTMLVRIYGVTKTESEFADVPSGSWYESFVATAADRGWILGYGDGTFCPDAMITRAEAVVVMNRVLGRQPDKEVIAAGVGIRQFVDVTSDDWFYWDVMEASVAHDYEISSGIEKWTDYEKAETYPAGFQTIDGVYCYVSAETGQPVWLEFGLNEVEEDVWVYAAEAGYEIHTNLSEQTLVSNNFNQVDGHTFFWEGTEPRCFTQGLNEIYSWMFYADEDGYFINTSFGAGVVELGGKLYIAGGNCNIVTTYYDYTSGTAVERDLAKKTYEYDKNMYYVKEDYSLARDEWIQYLYFDENGKYTSGDATLDAYVYALVDDFIDNNALTPEKKLLRAYYAIRGGSGAEPEPASGYWYINYGDGYARDHYDEQIQYSWLIRCANKFFSTKLGSCYYWASAYLYCARRLGFQSYAVVGDVFNEGTRHCWCMIYWDGYWHISDVEVEWGYLNKYYDRNTSYYFNLFDQTVSTRFLSYYQSPECSSVRYYFPD